MTRTGTRLKKIVWSYYAAHGRHELPWRAPSLGLRRPESHLDPYAIVVSEVMLQQTQVERVVPKFTTWLKQFPDWSALAEASLADVLTLWQGLGYNRRALNLQRCAQVIVKDYAGQLPRDEKSLLALPGIGPYTAGAVRAFAFNEPVVMIETNIRTVFLHHYWPAQNNAQAKIHDKELIPLIDKTLDQEKPREWYWALMDYGSHLKKTVGNPAQRSAHHVRQSTFAGSHRQVRGAILRLLTTAPSLTDTALRQALVAEGIEVTRIVPALTELVQEGFITISKSKRVYVNTSKST